MNAEIRGWNECLITYVLAASSPRYSIDAKFMIVAGLTVIILKMTENIMALNCPWVLITAALYFLHIILFWVLIRKD